MGVKPQVLSAEILNCTRYSEDEGLLEALRASDEYFSCLPETFELQFHLDFSPKGLGGDDNVIMKNLFSELHGWLGFFIFTNVYKTKHLIQDIEHGLNDSNYIRVTSASRTIMENAATINYYNNQLEPLFTSTIPDGMNIINLIKILKDYSLKSRFNWKNYLFDAEFKKNWAEMDENHRQTNVLTMLGKLPQEENAVAFYYHRLCDFVHPNAASHILYINQVIKGEEKVTYKLSSNTDAIDLLADVIHIISVPTKTSLGIIMRKIKYLIIQLNRVELILNQFKDNEKQ
ncbi:hypothetical protein CN316_22130 [Bacillus cereus]|nr:hypothetical protein CN316_22130 [Bacillus cereus]